ncbi:helix-turn-helix domain-containing protein [Streptomyces sp. NBC_00638]|uniref:helix-turn-helix domain-containing protein n=1 Tax=Streptomyces sp. NBC_00638 TaxID=2975794 RepID=UPI00225A60CF|nr:helix-turn-helix domain-containing protein [Streptomyces sp. NBC_00638]MCX5008900.1 helix-turn-helix domain-containing protein [Streptomyces sp. NBC_00638]
MLRIHFTEVDLARTRLASRPDPLWEIASSLHRFQTRRGRWAYAGWYRSAAHRLTESGLAPTVRSLLIPAFPRAAYYPDFLTPPESQEGLAAGIEAILATPRDRVLREVALIADAARHPWLPRLAEPEQRRTLADALRAYHETAIRPYEEQMQARIDADRAVRARAFLDGGAEGLLSSLAPRMNWRPPALEVEDHMVGGDLYLNGRGLVLLPSYFIWHSPVTLADPGLPPVLVYPLLHKAPLDPVRGGGTAALDTLLGRTRTAVLLASAHGATSTEAARAAGVSAATVSFHTRALRDAGLIASERLASHVLHTLTPLGAALLREARRGPRPAPGSPTPAP